MQFRRLHDIVHNIDPALGKRSRCKDVVELGGKIQVQIMEKGGIYGTAPYMTEIWHC